MKYFQYKYYMLVLLTMVAVFNYLDRGVLALAMEPIKQEFDLSDSQLGLMSGFAFALFYAVAGIPIARWADRGNRNHVVSLTTGIWSLMIVISGLVGSFSQLLLVRVGIAVGESGCTPPAQSLIADYFDRAERPRAMSIYWLSGPIAVIISFVLGGWLIENVGWRMTFILMGIPGVLLALLVKITLREPRLIKEKNTTCISNAVPLNEKNSLRIVLKNLWQGKSFRQLVIIFCISTFFSAGIGVWIPAFFFRAHGVGIGEIGMWLGLLNGTAGLISVFLGGYLAARFAPNRESLQLKCITFSVALSSVFYALCFFSPTHTSSFAFLFFVWGLEGLGYAPVYAMVQSLAEEKSRAVALAFILLITNLIGLGFGPLVVGFLSDVLEPELGQESLRYAMLLCCPGYLWCAYHCWKASGTIEEDIRLIEVKAASVEIEENEQEGHVSYKAAMSKVNEGGYPL